MKPAYLLAIDQGTSSTKTLIVSEKGEVVAKGHAPLKTDYQANGFVEQDPEGIYANVLESVAACFARFTKQGGKISDLAACGISNQRETFVLWDETGRALGPAVVWQCKRSVGICSELKAAGLEPLIREKTGLIIDPYFSGTKLLWLTRHEPEIREKLAAGTLYFGTVDTWLLFKLTQGAVYATDHTNASRTLFFNLHNLTWDEELLETFGLKGLNLPEVRPSSHVYGHTDCGGILPTKIPLAAMIGDSHAAAFGEGLFAPGMAKATLGTGCSILMNIGQTPKPSAHGMVTTLCWSTEQRLDYALEGIIVSCGATIAWLRDALNLFEQPEETEALANSLPDNQGVYLVPAFSGLGAPHWQMERKASVVGMTFDTGKAHLVRAALEAIPYQIKDVVVAMEQDTGLPLHSLIADGGISQNAFVMQFMADLLGKPVASIRMADVSALGAAYLAGLATGVFQHLEQLTAMLAEKQLTQPRNTSPAIRAYAGWQAAVGH